MRTSPNINGKPKPGRLKPRQIKAMELIIVGYTYQEVADQLGITRQTISHWKNHDEDFRAKLAELQSDAEEQLSNMIPAANVRMLSRLQKLADEASDAIALEAIKYFFLRFSPREDERSEPSFSGFSPQDVAIMRAFKQQQDRTQTGYD